MQSTSGLTVKEFCHTCRQVRSGWHPVWTEKTMTSSSQWAYFGQQGWRLSGVTSDEHLLGRVSVVSLVSQTKDEPSIWVRKLILDPVCCSVAALCFSSELEEHGWGIRPQTWRPLLYNFLARTPHSAEFLFCWYFIRMVTYRKTKHLNLFCQNNK